MKKILKILCLMIIIPLMGKDLTPTMFVLKDPDNPSAGKEALSITKVAAEVIVHGDLAETSITLTFLNSSKRNVEGRFFFPLPDHSVITGYALDIGDKMVDGVAVEKKRAQTVFERIKRRMIDPGLVEWHNKNCFKTRVYPIFGGKSRTIRIKYLTEIKGGKFILPLNYKKKIPEFTMLIKVLTPKFPPKIIKGDPGLVTFKQEYAGTTISGKWQDFTPATDLELAIDQNPDYAKPGSQVEPWDQAFKDLILVENSQDRDFFKVSTFLKPMKNKVVKPEKITIIWDASGSRTNADHDAVLRKLINYFEKHKNRNIAVDVKVFRDLPELTKSFQVNKGNYQELTKFLRNIYYDGATRFGVVKPDEKPPSFYLYVTDGKSVMQDNNVPVFNAPVFTISACPKPNFHFLTDIASASGGQWINAFPANQQDVPQIGELPFSFISAEYNDLVFKRVFPATPEKVSGPFMLSGEIERRKGNIKVNFGYGNKTEISKEFLINTEKAVFAPLLEKFQALKKLEKFLVNPDVNRSKIIQLGQKYGLVTPYTSLIVLESLRQYVEFRIPPPKSLPDMRKSYFSKVKLLENDNPFIPRHGWRSAFYESGWQDKVMWWNTIFKYPEDFKYKPFKCYEADFRTFDEEAFFDDHSDDDFEAESAFGITVRSALITRVAPVAGGDEDDFDDEDDFGDDGALDDDDLGFDLGGEVGSYNPGIEPETAPHTKGGVFIKIVDPKPVYIEEMEILEPEEQLVKYIEYRKKYAQSPGFYLKCANFFARKNKKLSLQILSNFFEMGMDNFVAKRIIANHYERLGELDQAIEILRNTEHIKGKRPFLLRDLGLLYLKRAEKGNPLEKKADYSAALRYLIKAFNQSRNNRFKDIILLEINNIFPKAEAAGLEYHGFPEWLQKPLDMDLRIVVSGFGGNLQVVEPSGETVSRTHPLSLTGGYFGSSWGLREYFTRKAMKGNYSIFIDTVVPLNNFGSGLMKVDVFTNYGRPNQKLQTYFLDIVEDRENLKVGEVKF